MNCQQIRKLIHPHHDSELDAANTLQVDEHLADCPACFDLSRRLSTLRGALQNQDLRFTAPAALRRNIVGAIRDRAESEREVAPRASRFQYGGWIAAAVVLLASLFTLHLSTIRRDDRIAGELVASHVRSLMAEHLMDVASTDQHTVKPWFDGKLDFAPPVKDFRDSGFPLLGGRLDVIDGHPAAALVFGRHKHLLNLFVWPARTSEVAAPHATQRNGYNVIQWSDGAMTYAVVSDLNQTELEEFVGEWSGK
jgi:anti-sigma factor RsiW